MTKNIQIRLSPADGENEFVIRSAILNTLGIRADRLSGYQLLKKSIDARKKEIYLQLSLLVFIDEPFVAPTSFSFQFKDVNTCSKSVIIIGAGPAGLFAALKFIESGIKPIILERGKNVRDRRRDLALLNKTGAINPNSNYCFGEGGAGTYSDGKLYTRSNKRGDVQRILDLFVLFGADDRILYEAHPHIGTNKLPRIIEAMREKIIACGGEIHFNTLVSDLLLEKNKIKSVVTDSGAEFKADAYLLATGHSARDIFLMLYDKQIRIEAKPFALGVRVEHPQSLIDSIQYHCTSRPAGLPPAAYTLVDQVDKRGVFSFCMCPGGIIATASTDQGELVVNGWSPSKRNNPFANSGMVVEVDQQSAHRTLQSKHIQVDHPLLFMYFQQMTEQKAFQAGGGRFVAPAQRLVDFCERKVSTTIPANSYIPGVASSQLNEVLPNFVSQSLRGGFKSFGKKLKGYYSNEAILIATESRTSSPVRIPRDPLTGQHPQISNLFPCGEGAGYAGGIMSAAMDGERTAVRIKDQFGL